MAEALALAASITGLIALAQGLAVPLISFYGDAKSSTGLTPLVGDLRSLCGVLVALQPVIQQLENQGAAIPATREG
jgi:hypothetical protein